jgi:hypothetical protein
MVSKYPTRSSISEDNSRTDVQDLRLLRDRKRNWEHSPGYVVWTATPDKIASDEAAETKISVLRKTNPPSENKKPSSGFQQPLYEQIYYPPIF